MNANRDQIIAMGKASADAVNKFAQTQFSTFELVYSLNFKAAQAAFADGFNHAASLLSVRGARDLVELNVAAAQPAFERAIAYLRELNMVAAQAQAGLLKLSELRAVGASRAAVVPVGDASGARPVVAAKRARKNKAR